MTEKEKKTILRQRTTALLCPPDIAMRIIEPYKNLGNYLNPEYEPKPPKK